MIVEFNDAENRGITETDICIIGARAAGITLAREYIGTSVRVCVLESGDLEFSAGIQALAEGRMSVFLISIWPLRDCAFLVEQPIIGRVCVRSPIDFETRQWVRYSGWPIAKTELEPYYARVQEMCQ